MFYTKYQFILSPCKRYFTNTYRAVHSGQLVREVQLHPVHLSVPEGLEIQAHPVVLVHPLVQMDPEVQVVLLVLEVQVILAVHQVQALLVHHVVLVVQRYQSDLIEMIRQFIHHDITKKNILVKENEVANRSSNE